jgi:hypothetical protein
MKFLNKLKFWNWRKKYVTNKIQPKPEFSCVINTILNDLKEENYNKWSRRNSQLWNDVNFLSMEGRKYELCVGSFSYYYDRYFVRVSDVSDYPFSREELDAVEFAVTKLMRNFKKIEDNKKLEEGKQQLRKIFPNCDI